jgi:opacity protein-like surface antigen
MKHNIFKINTLKLITVLAAMAAALASSGRAQESVTETNASGGTTTISNPQSFFGTVGSYFTTSNTNLPFKGKAEIGLGLAYQSGVNIASDFDARYKFAVTTNSGVILESVTRNAGVGGIIVSEQAGVGYYYIPSATPDIELSAGLLGGYRFDVSQGAFTAYLDARKSLTANTFAGVRLAYEYDGSASPSSPVLTAYTGFTF